jgi:hypothetical protein
MSDSESKKQRLIIKAGDQATEIQVRDSSLREVARGLGRLDATIPQGIYKVRFRTGSVSSEQLVVVDAEGDEVSIRQPRDAFASPIPLAETTTSHEYHMEAAYRLSRETPRSIGHGARLFLFSRDLCVADPGGADHDHPATGLTLSGLDGEEVADLSSEGSCDLSAGIDPWAGCHLELDPGSYRLRLDAGPHGCFEQILYLPRHWQTQVFLLRRSFAAIRRVDLTSSSVMHARESFTPSDEHARLAELGRQGLSRRRVVLKKEDLRQMLDGKFEHPMVGLYGAHLLTLRAKPNREVLETVVGNLGRLLGDHPDVRVLELWLRDAWRDGDEPFASPPMLRNSWDVLHRLSARYAGLVPAGSLTAKIGRQLWGEGAWLIWQVEGEHRPLRGPVAASLRPHEEPELDDLEQTALFQLLRRKTRLSVKDLRPDGLPKQLPGPDLVPADPDEEMVQALGVPWPTAAETLDRLRRHLTRTDAENRDK